MARLAILQLGVTLLFAGLVGCGDDGEKAAASADPSSGQAPANEAKSSEKPVVAPPPKPAPAPAPNPAPDATAGGDTTADAPVGNAWNLTSQPATANAGDRVYVLTRGRDRTYNDANAVYQLYAYDVATAHKDTVTLQQLGGGRFTVPALFVIPAGTPVKQLRKGDMVLAEWASSLKHAIITGFDGQMVTIRYLDLPESWAAEKIAATKDARELTKQSDGFHPGNYAIAEMGGNKELVMLVTKSEETWLVRKFAGRVVALHRSKITTIPLKPKIRRRQKVMVPWIGLMYEGKVAKIVGARVLVNVDGIGQKQAITVPLGQVLPLSR